MGEAAEAGDQIGVEPREAEVVGPSAALGVARGEVQGPGLGSGVLMMLEWQVEERLEVRLEGEIETVRDRLIGDGARQPVGGEGVRGVAVYVAGELVEEQDEGEGALRRSNPGGELAARRPQMDALETCTDGFVKLRVWPEPRLLACVAPEADDLAGRGQGGHGRSPGSIGPRMA